MTILEYTSDYSVRNFKESYYIKINKLTDDCLNVDEGPSNSKLLEFTVNLTKENSS